MRIAVLMDPVQTIHPDKDSSFVIMLEALKRNHTVLSGHPNTLRAHNNRVVARLSPTVVKRATPHFELAAPEDVYLDEVEAVFMRKDPPFHMEYVFSTYILDLLAHSTLVINDPVGLKKANEKMYPLHFPTLIPKTLVTREIAHLKAFLDEQGGVMIVKPWDGNGGRGVLLISKEDRNLNSLLEISTGDETRYVVAQAYIPEVRTGDKRVILIDGEPRGAILRVPPENENRGNMHTGARVEPYALSERDLEICDTLAPALRRDGLLFVGIDIIGDYLTEVNVTSPTGLQEINAFDGTCLEAEILDRVEDHIHRGVRRLGT